MQKAPHHVRAPARASLVSTRMCTDSLCTTLQELCRQRMARTDVRGGGATDSNKARGASQQPRHLSSGSW